MERLTGNEFIDKLKTAEGKTVTTDSNDLEIILYDWNEESQETITYYGPDPDKLDYLQYMSFLSDIYKYVHLKDFVYAYVFRRLMG